jgi:hypothetical protein
MVCIAAPSGHDLAQSLKICRDQTDDTSFSAPCGVLSSYVTNNPLSPSAIRSVHGLKGADASVASQLLFVTTIAGQTTQ